ncbi:nucleotide sugar dehydrogenase [Enterocloster aldenensis]|uniref:nucleotide sugar dehydrogenase n=1 Tax=Enterocloster aldenensis TaxID=358742 RepID=UPI001D0829B8|nr:nucleotide sugar dehydrogenase [Enterocloster aldenensis]
MEIYEEIISRRQKISIIGLGYVGLPIAIAFSKKTDVIGFDVNKYKIEQYMSGIDTTMEVGNIAIQNCSVDFTADEYRLKEAGFHIVAVPTPVRSDHTPDLSLVESASHILGRNLVKGSIVVYESTVYPGVTENICIPILEKESKLVAGQDFKVGYSPERINPGDKIHRLETITKIVSGMDADSLDTIAKVYELVVEAGVYRAKNIKVAEAAKVIENSQRDINIAFMNELSIIFNKMGIDTKDVLEAAETKWNFLKFYPGLVGGHCIGVDPYYLTYIAELMGYHSQIILSGRRINDDMGKYIAENLVKKLVQADIGIKNAKVAILGLTFKENCPDTRNTKVVDIINELAQYDIHPIVSDPVADEVESYNEYKIQLQPLNSIKNVDAVILAVNHTDFQHLTIDDFNDMYRSSLKSPRIIIDVKGILKRSDYEKANYIYWRL